MHRSPLALLDPPGETASVIAAARDACRDSFAKSLAAARPQDKPYRHWILRDVLPASVAAAMDALPFPAPALNGVSGSREIHNNTRTYVDAQAIAKHGVCAAVAEAFQHPDTVATVEAVTGARLDGCCLRIEYAQDTDGFWLQPHTDLGVKKFTLLYYLGPDGQPDLGTDVYSDGQTWAHRAPFEVGAALAFVPSDRTWHGFEPRPIPVVRKSLIVNYVTAEWMAREQLAYPDTPVTGRKTD
ncbi:hypothetical protein [Phenylobacterium sp.]|jgi:hypothetical protein|uniref:hypothetical protein n=1 Tax=Phenylobacterium sp. TaxID=1871053 RepID=UPI002E31346A|nr:hypothetical protein [Phenylobacterium sp.]HEX3366313.1 hypothetical protein [Phenylobacterium sp.]